MNIYIFFRIHLYLISPDTLPQKIKKKTEVERDKEKEFFVLLIFSISKNHKYPPYWVRNIRLIFVADFHHGRNMDDTHFFFGHT